MTSGINCPEWAGINCYKQMKDAALPKIGKGNTYTKKSHVHAFNVLHTCSSLCTSSTYSSKKHLLSGNNSFNGCDV